MSTTSTAPRRGSGARLLRWLVTLLLAAALGAAAVLGALYALGLRPTTPQELADTRALLLAVQTQVAAQQQASDQLRTAVAEQEHRRGADRETLDDVQARLAALGDVDRRLAAGTAQNATAAAELRSARDTLATAATQIGRLQAQADRVDRFLRQLGQLSGEAAGDLLAPTPTPTPTPPP